MKKIGLASSALAEVLLCPSCRNGGLVPAANQSIVCSACGMEHLFMGNMPCLYTDGIAQKSIWRHNIAMMTWGGQQYIHTLKMALKRKDLRPLTSKRLQTLHTAYHHNQQTIIDLFAKAGIAGEIREDLAGQPFFDVGGYFSFIARDWAWDSPHSPFERSSENADHLERVLRLVNYETWAGKRVLVLGAGAGRLSWDLLCALQPDLMLALDNNPLLLMVADRLIKHRKKLVIAETNEYPQIGKTPTHFWELQPPADDANMAERWFAVCANAWDAPLQAQSFDVVITPWFLDVNGGDPRLLIGLVRHLLKAGGTWINTGPLLFTAGLPAQHKYSAEELSDFIQLAGFDMLAQQVEEVEHLAAPLMVRRRREQVWTFAAAVDHNKGAADPRAWLYLHFIPVPESVLLQKNAHPIAEIIYSLVDGQRSVGDIAIILAPHLPEGQDATLLVLDCLAA